MVIVQGYIMQINPKHNDEVRYYETFAGYNIPFKLQGQISKAEADNRTTYYVGTYRHNLLINVKKVHQNQLLFEDSYFYQKTWYGRYQLTKRICIDEFGNETIKTY